MGRFTNTEIFAVLVSVASVAISVNGNRTQERLLSASVWPYLSFGTGNTSDDGQSKLIVFSVTNSGNGPARIKDFVVEYDHQEISGPQALMDRCCGFKPSIAITSPVVARVLRPGEELKFLQLPFSADIADGWRVFDKNRFQVNLSACYCSTLNECWKARSDQPVRNLLQRAETAKPVNGTDNKRSNDTQKPMPKICRMSASKRLHGDAHLISFRNLVLESRTGRTFDRPVC